MPDGSEGAEVPVSRGADCAPILLIGFNRPNQFRQVLDEILRANPARLYIAIDGPRASHPEDQAKVAEVRALVSVAKASGINTKVLIREHNLGCRDAVSGAIDWFFDQEEAGIILEDDCLPKPDFFNYCTELLAHWWDEESVFTISGCGIAGGSRKVAESYAFATIPYIWGWASWRRAWRHYRDALSAWQELRHTDWIDARSQGYRDHERYWRNAFDGVLNGRIDTWATQWALAHWVHGGVCAVPVSNLITNLGFGAEATHTTAEKTPAWMSEDRPLLFPLRHPQYPEVDPSVDRYIVRRHFRTMYPWFHPRSVVRSARKVVGSALRGVGLRR